MASTSSTIDVGEFLRAACRRRGLSACDVARLCDITSEYMCDMVAGRRPATVEVAERLIAVLRLGNAEASELLRLAGHGDATDVRLAVVHPSMVD